MVTPHRKDLQASITYLSLPWFHTASFLLFFWLQSFWPFKREGIFIHCLISNTYINNHSSEGEGGRSRRGRWGVGRRKATWFPGPNWEPLTSNGGSSWAQSTQLRADDRGRGQQAMKGRVGTDAQKRLHIGQERRVVSRSSKGCLFSRWAGLGAEH